MDLLVDVCRTVYYLFQKMHSLSDVDSTIATIHNYYGICQWVNKDVVCQMSNIYVLMLQKFKQQDFATSLSQVGSASDGHHNETMVSLS